MLNHRRIRIEMRSRYESLPFQHGAAVEYDSPHHILRCLYLLQKGEIVGGLVYRLYEEVLLVLPAMRIFHFIWIILTFQR